MYCVRLKIPTVLNDATNDFIPVADLYEYDSKQRGTGNCRRGTLRLQTTQPVLPPTVG